MSSTTGHENEAINVQGLKASLQKFKDDVVDKVITNAYYHNGAFYEEAAHTTEITGEEGKIYIDIPTNREYRWDGAKYVLLKSEVEGSFIEESTFTYRPTAGALDVESRAVGEGGAAIESVKGNSVAWNQLLNPNDWVDMGLPSGTVWCKKNIDVTQPNGLAASPFQYDCSFFSWGNTDGHNPISDSAFDYTFDQTTYDSTTGATLTSDITLPNDAANFVKGAIFRMPTKDEFAELLNNIDFVQADGETVIDVSQTNKLVTVNDIVGIYLKSKINGNLLFLACSGSSYTSTWMYKGEKGWYLSDSFLSKTRCYTLFINNDGIDSNNGTSRINGFAIRPVVSKSVLQEGKDSHKFASYDGGITDTTLMYGSGSEPTTLDAFKSDLINKFGRQLPYDAEIEYLEGTGTQYIDTSIYLQEGDDVECVICNTNIKPSGENKGWGCGTLNTNTYDIAAGLRVRIGQSSYFFFGKNYSFTPSLTVEDYDYYREFVHLSRQDAYVELKHIDEGTIYTINNISIGETFPNTTVLLFRGNGTYANPGAKRIKYFKIYRNDTLALDLIPVRVGNVGYMYDRVSGQLLGNQGTDSFVLGNDTRRIGRFEYDEGSIKNVKMNAIESIGFNQFNNGKANVISGMEYQITGTYTSLTLNGETITPDANGKFTPESDGELTVVGGGNDTCIHLVHSGDRDGDYEPYWKNTKAIDVIHIYGKANGEGELVQVFPDGMQGIGNKKDSIHISNGVVIAEKVIDSVDLGSITWRYNGATSDWGNCLMANLTVVPNMLGDGSIVTTLCDRYESVAHIPSTSPNKNMIVGKAGVGNVYVRDFSYTDADVFKEAMSGVILYYVVATPVTYTDLVYMGSEEFADGTPVTLPVDYSVDDYGTEKVTSDASMSLAPTLDIRYGINAKDTIRNLPYKYVSAVEPQNFTEQQKQIARTNIGAVALSDVAYMFTNLPTTDPEVVGALWNDGGIVKISAGAAQVEPEVEP